MGQPLKTILNTDYATLKNDSDTVTITFTIPANAIGGGATQQYSAEINAGVAGSSMEYDINCSISTRRWKTPRLMIIENMGAPNQYQMFVSVYRTGPTTIKCLAVVFNGNPGAVTKNSRTITARVRTFIPPTP